MQFPTYPAIFCPAGVERPAHIRSVHATDVVVPEAAPGGAVGRLWSPAPIDKIAGPWVKTLDGWYIALGDAISPRKYARLRMIQGGTTVFTEAGLPFIVPKLLQFNPEGDGLFSATPRVFKDNEWKDPEYLTSIMERLRIALGDGGTAAPLPEDPDTLALAIDILALNYHISIHECSALGWIDSGFVERVMLAAGGYADLQSYIEKAMANCPAK